MVKQLSLLVLAAIYLLLFSSSFASNARRAKQQRNLTFADLKGAFLATPVGFPSPPRSLMSVLRQTGDPSSTFGYTDMAGGVSLRRAHGKVAWATANGHFGWIYLPSAPSGYKIALSNGSKSCFVHSPLKSLVPTYLFAQHSVRDAISLNPRRKGIHPIFLYYQNWQTALYNIDLIPRKFRFKLARSGARTWNISNIPFRGQVQPVSFTCKPIRSRYLLASLGCNTNDCFLLKPTSSPLLYFRFYRNLGIHRPTSRIEPLSSQITNNQYTWWAKNSSQTTRRIFKTAYQLVLLNALFNNNSTMNGTKITHTYKFQRRVKGIHKSFKNRMVRKWIRRACKNLFKKEQLTPRESIFMITNCN